MKKQIAVIFGGRSAEHDVSIITAHIPIIQSLIATQSYDVWPVYIAKDGAWYSDKAMNDLDYFKHDLDKKLAKQKKIQISFDGGLKFIWPGFKTKSVQIDIAFPAMHGTYGEDGTIMGLLRLAGIPFVGCDLSASAVAMDKVFTKQILDSENLPIVPYVWFNKYDWDTSRSEQINRVAKLTWPLFVKPVHLGSSIAISKVRTEKELENAVELAFHYDNKILIEESVEKLIEVTLPILGNSKPKLALIEQAPNNTDFFDFNEKYISNGKKSEGANPVEHSGLPAKISDDLSQKVKSLGEKTYKALGCEGIARVDFLINSDTNTIFINEVNTLPGSLYHHNWKKSGVSNVELIKTLIDLAYERHATQKNITTIFASDILDNLAAKKMSA